MTHLYVAGPMTGLPGYNLVAFREAASLLNDAGYEVTNPGRHGVVEGFEWADYMRRGLAELLKCDGVALLDGWEQSKGAQLEVYVAKSLYMPVAPKNEWISA